MRKKDHHAFCLRVERELGSDLHSQRNEPLKYFAYPAQLLRFLCKFRARLHEEANLPGKGVGGEVW